MVGRDDKPRFARGKSQLTCTSLFSSLLASQSQAPVQRPGRASYSKNFDCKTSCAETKEKISRTRKQAVVIEDPGCKEGPGGSTERGRQRFRGRQRSREAEEIPGRKRTRGPQGAEGFREPRIPEKGGDPSGRRPSDVSNGRSASLTPLSFFSSPRGAVLTVMSRSVIFLRKKKRKIKRAKFISQ